MPRRFRALVRRAPAGRALVVALAIVVLGALVAVGPLSPADARTRGFRRGAPGSLVATLTHRPPRSLPPATVPMTTVPMTTVPTPIPPTTVPAADPSTASTAVPTTGSPVPSTNPTTNPTANPTTGPAPAGDDLAARIARTNRRGFLNFIGRPMTGAEADQAAADYAVVVLKLEDVAAARRIKAANPDVVVLAYQCLASTRSTDDPTHVNAGVLYAQADPSWFALDTAGNRIAWPYAAHWQMAVWNPAYQDAWVSNVVARIEGGPFDGVMADNDMYTLKWYSSALFRGTTSTAATDAQLRGGLDTLVAKAGAALQARGKVLVPNISEGDTGGRWAAHSRYGGAMEEQFLHYSGAPSSYTGAKWTSQTAELGGPGVALAITHADTAANTTADAATKLYGYASTLVAGSPTALYMPTIGTDGYAAIGSLIPEELIRLGPPTGGPQAAGGAWTRRFQTGWAAVNPTGSPVTVTRPDGTPVTLQAATGIVIGL